jgi:anti-sigma regulatory factor (Ser/Thr protein kinase)
MAEREYQFRVKSAVPQLEKVRKWAAYIARGLGFDDRAVFEVELSIYEACANVIEHAYGNNPHKYIDLRMAVELDRLIVTIRDQGGTFEPSSLKEKNIARIIETEQDGGLGMHIIEACMDEILYRRQGGENILELVKYLPAGAPPS